MHDLDGSNAGGQFVRSALALSVLQNEPIRLEHVRGDRSTPGLRHQHLAVLETMVEICDAEVLGMELGAETVVFDPDLGNETGSNGDEYGPEKSRSGRLPGGSYAVDIGTAGSVTLLFESLLPLATMLDTPLSITATGGTDVKWSPPIDYFRHVKLPLVSRYGLEAACEVERRGFYPDGGGRATLRLAPSELEPIELTERGPIEAVRIYSIEAESLADRDVARRQVKGARERLALDDTVERDCVDGTDWDGRDETDRESRDATDDSLGTVSERQETTVDSHCPGSAVVIRIDHGTGFAGFTALGERGKPAERVGEEAADAANRWLAGTAPIDRHMADQLLLPLAIAGGRLCIPTVTDHVTAGQELLASFGIEPPLDNGETTIVSVDSPTRL